MVLQLSAQFKAPVRNVIGEVQEIISNHLSTIIQQLAQMNVALKNSNAKVISLQKLCTDNNIAFEVPRSTNRAERRAKERKQAKIVKNTPNTEK